MTPSVWKLVVTSLGGHEPARELLVPAENWLSALRDGRRELGEDGGVPAGASCVMSSTGEVTILDASKRRRYVLTRTSHNTSARAATPRAADGAPTTVTKPEATRPAAIAPSAATTDTLTRPTTRDAATTNAATARADSPADTSTARTSAESTSTPNSTEQAPDPKPALVTPSKLEAERAPTTSPSSPTKPATTKRDDEASNPAPISPPPPSSTPIAASAASPVRSDDAPPPAPRPTPSTRAPLDASRSLPAPTRNERTDPTRDERPRAPTPASKPPAPPATARPPPTPNREATAPSTRASSSATPSASATPSHAGSPASTNASAAAREPMRPAAPSSRVDVGTTGSALAPLARTASPDSAPPPARASSVRPSARSEAERAPLASSPAARRSTASDLSADPTRTERKPAERSNIPAPRSLPPPSPASLIAPTGARRASTSPPAARASSSSAPDAPARPAGGASRPSARPTSAAPRASARPTSAASSSGPGDDAPPAAARPNVDAPTSTTSTPVPDNTQNASAASSTRASTATSTPPRDSNTPFAERPARLPRERQTLAYSAERAEALRREFEISRSLLGLPTNDDDASVASVAPALPRPNVRALSSARPRSTPPASPTAADEPPPSSAPPSEPDLKSRSDLVPLSARDVDPTNQSPLSYRERAYWLPGPHDRGRVEVLLQAELNALRRELGARPRGQFVNLAVFDEPFEGSPPRAPLATLEWKDWRGPPVFTMVTPPSDLPRDSIVEPLTPLSPASAKLTKLAEPAWRYGPANHAPHADRSGDPARPAASESAEPSGDADGRLATAFEAMPELYFLPTPVAGLEFALQLLRRLVPSEAVSSCLYDVNTDEFRFVALTGPGAAEKRASAIPSSAGLFGAARRARTDALVVTDPAHELHFDPRADGRVGLSVRTLAYLPVRHHGALLGMLQLINREQRRDFSASDVAVLTYVAAQLGEFLSTRRGLD